MNYVDRGAALRTDNCAGMYCVREASTRVAYAASAKVPRPKPSEQPIPITLQTPTGARIKHAPQANQTFATRRVAQTPQQVSNFYYRQAQQDMIQWTLRHRQA